MVVCTFNWLGGWPGVGMSRWVTAVRSTSAMQAVGTRSAILLLREAYYGVTRFRRFPARTGATGGASAGGLEGPVEEGRPGEPADQEPGAGKGDGVQPAARGVGRFRGVSALAQWSNEHHAAAAPIKLSHADCDAPVTIKAECSEGHTVDMDQLTVSS